MTNIVTYQSGGNELALDFGETGAMLQRMDDAITTKAAANLETALAEYGDAFSAPERRAMLLAEEVKLTGDFDLAQILLRGKRLKQIRDEALFSVHPEGYTSLETMAKDMGISASELSNIEVLYNEIFPWLSQRGANLVLLWEEIGKSNFREIIPYLRSLISGEPSNSDSVNDRVNEIIREINELNPGTTIEEATLAAVDTVLDAGRHTTRELRAQLRPTRTPAINASMIKDADSNYILVARMTEDQRIMLSRLLRSNIDEIVYELPGDENVRRQTVASIAEVRQLLNLVN